MHACNFAKFAINYMANNPFGSFEDTFEQGVSQVTNQVKKQVSDTAKSANSQVTGQQLSDTAIGADVSANKLPVNDQSIKQDPVQAAGDDPAVSDQQLAQMNVASQQEQQQKLIETRNKLKAHKDQHNTTYFDPTFNPPKKEQPLAEKLEQEKAQEEQKKMQELEEQKKKDEPIALARAKRTTEMNRGSSG